MSPDLAEDAIQRTALLGARRLKFRESRAKRSEDSVDDIAKPLDWPHEIERHAVLAKGRQLVGEETTVPVRVIEPALQHGKAREQPDERSRTIRAGTIRS